jgi:hypothetical protein
MFHSARWVEVKGRLADARERQLAAELTEQGQGLVYLLEGDIPRSPTGMAIVRHGISQAEAYRAPCISAPVWTSEDLFDDPMIWKNDIFALGSGLQSALTAARSARFEHGESGLR